jgi:lipopolysaccharide/colanic/teichoic acid biosynthesis glycosyltransferase
MKRAVDIVFSMTLILLFLPFGLVLAIVLRLTGEGKVFYFQPRIGFGGKAFKLVKFATMLENSPHLGSGDITLKGDSRVLPIGRFLRMTKINEIPQVLNVIKGDMTLVGPRPLTPKNFALYPERVKEEIVKVRPGVTGVGSIVFRDEESILAGSSKSYLEAYRDEIAIYKGELELWYMKNRNFFLDMKIIMLTGWVVLFKDSALPYRVLKSLPRRSQWIPKAGMGTKELWSI